MTATDRMTLIEAAKVSYDEFVNASTDEADERYAKQVEDFLTCARATAKVRFGVECAAELEWTYTSPDDLPDGMEEATALLAKGRMDWLRFRCSTDGDTVAFELVKQCGECGQEQANEVSGLTRLGELLAAKGGDQ